MESGEKKVFNSDLELDSFLSSKIDEFIEKENDVTLQVDPQQITKNKIDDISKTISEQKIEVKTINEDGDTETELKIPNSIGVTSFVTTYGNPDSIESPLLTPFDQESYFQKEKERLLGEGKTPQEVENIIQNLLKSWKIQTDYGTEIHSLFESIINPNVSFKRKLLTEEQVNNLTEQFSEFLDTLRKRHGRNAKFLTEIPIISKNINESYKRAGINSINGRIDLLVIDSNGMAHIYDYKVSKKEVGNWNETDNRRNLGFWHSTKKLGAGYQLAMYRSILEQYNIKVKTTAIIPIKLNITPNLENPSELKLEDAYIDTDNIRGMIDQQNPIGSQGLPYTTNMKIVSDKILPKETMLDNIDLMHVVQEPMSKIFPNYELETQIQRTTITVEKKRHDRSFVKDILPGDQDESKGKWKFFDEFKKRYIYANTEDELKSALQEFVDKENSNRGSELAAIAETIIEIQNGSATLDDLASDNKFKSDFCKRIFRKYCDSTSGYSSSWTLINNPQFISAGLFVFQKEGTDIIEIVSITYNQPDKDVDLGKGKSLLGAFKTDAQIDNKKILRATNGNVDLIKTIMIVNNTPALKNYKINKTSSFNIWTQKGTSLYNEQLLYNFRELCINAGIPVNLDSRNFASTLESIKTEIEDIAGEQLVREIGNWTITFKADDIIKGVEWCLDKMESLKKLNSSEGLRRALSDDNWNFDDPNQLAYMLLGRALNKLNGYEVYIEKDPLKWIGWRDKSFHTGTWINSPGQSPSLNIQTLAKIFSVAETKIRRIELSYSSKINSILKAFYDYNQRSRFKGGEVEYFDNLFVKDSTGKIDPKFRLKNPDDPGLSKEESNMIKKFAEIVNDLKYNGDKRLIEKAKTDGTYYDVPITLASSQTLFHNNNLKTAIKTKYDSAINFLRLLPEQEALLQESSRSKDAYNKYDITDSTRQQIIDKNGVNMLETNLEKILRDVIHAYTNQQVMREFLPRLQAVKICLQFSERIYGEPATGIIDYVDKFITKNVYSKPIMDSGIYPVHKLVSAVKDVATYTTLGWNYRSGIRELLQGMWTHITRNWAEAYGKDQFTIKDLKEAWSFILKEAVKDRNNLTLLDALNVDYGMANADPMKVQERLSSSKYGIKNFSSNEAFIFNTAPDILHRMGILIAKMKHEGCWEAHSIVNDELVYDFKKDKRFSLLSDPKVDKNSKEYKSQHSLYTAMLEQFNKEGWNLNEGDALPRAYTIQEATSIKSFAELCFGHYDHSTQMMAKSTFIGAALLHFRTFLSSKLEQWILKPGTYDQGQIKIKYNDDGVMYVRVYETDDEGNVSVRIDLESNMTPQDNYEPYKEWQGRYMEGIVYSIVDLGKKIMSLDFNGMKELWANPTKQANLKLFISDMIWMSMMIWLLSLVFDYLKEEGEYTPVVHVFDSALTNSFADGNIINIMEAMGSDLNPPSYRIIQNLWKQTTGIITGDTSVIDAAINSFGALNSLKYLGETI